MLSLDPIEQSPVFKREMIRDHLAPKFDSGHEPPIPYGLKLAIYPMRFRFPAIKVVSIRDRHSRQRAKEQRAMGVKLIESVGAVLDFAHLAGERDDAHLTARRSIFCNGWNWQYNVTHAAITS